MKRFRPIRNGDYVVGYGRPPAATRFAPGVSGNPKGRPKARKTVGYIINDALQKRVKVEENGRSRTLSAQEVIILNLVNAAARRDLKAIQALFALQSRYAECPDTTLDPAILDPEDEAIIRDYMAGLSPDNTEGSPEPPARTGS